MKHKCVVIGGGTFNHISCHLALAAPAFGETAKTLHRLFSAHCPELKCELMLTKMADSSSKIVTNGDLANYIAAVLCDPLVKVIVMNAAVCDFEIENPTGEPRLSSSNDYIVTLKGLRKKMLATIAEARPDIVTVGFKTTKNASVEEQVSKALDSMRSNKLDVVLANDVGFYRNILVTRESYEYRSERANALRDVVDEAVRVYRDRNPHTIEVTTPENVKFWVIKTVHGYIVERLDGKYVNFFTMAADCKSYLLNWPDAVAVYLKKGLSKELVEAYTAATGKELWFEVKQYTTKL